MQWIQYYPNLTKKNFDKALTQTKREDKDFYLQQKFLHELYYEIKSNRKDLLETEFFKDLHKDLTRYVSLTLGTEVREEIKRTPSNRGRKKKA